MGTASRSQQADTSDLLQSADRTAEPGPGAVVVDARPQAARQRQLQAIADGSQRVQQLEAQRQVVLGSPDAMQLQPALPVRTNTTGLPDNVKTGIEMLSGLSMDDVSVHYHSPKPAQHQAHAYAQGTDVYVGPGQEHHLPHEAWHVVQQKQGRVPITRQMKQGVALNDDAALEREADEMGQKALQSGASGSVDRHANNGLDDPLVNLRSLSASGEPAIQRIATQVTLDDTNAISVRIVGRPPNVYSGSAGDHLTAFSVRQATLVRDLAHQNFWDALAQLDLTVGGIVELPGVAVIAAMADEPRKRLLAAWTHMRTLRLALPAPHELLTIDRARTVSALELTRLQDLISAYLDVVELIPFSTINVAAKSKALAGKGKGESGPLRRLRAAEDHLAETQARASTSASDTGGAPTSSDSDGDSDGLSLFEDFTGVFDHNAAALVAAELDSSLVQRMGGVFEDGADPLARLGRMVDHHIATMAHSFPRVMLHLGGEHLLRVELTNLVLADMREEWASTVEHLASRVQDYETQIQNWTATRGLLSKRATRQLRDLNTDIERNRERIESAKKQIAQCRQYLEQYAETKKKPQPKTSAPKRVNAQTKMADMSDESAKHDSKKRKHDEVHDVEDEDQSEDELDDADDASISELTSNALAGQQATTRVAGPAVQIRMQQTGIISEIEFAGRSPSPLIGGGMGAHTTAWIVHLDRLRQALIGTKIDDAPTILKLLWTEVEANGKRLADVFEDTDAGERNREEASGEIADVVARLASTKGDAQRVSLLQNGLRALLNFTNNVPGATLEATDTGGKSEGKSRRILLEAEHHLSTSIQREIESAIFGLLDTKVLEGEPNSKEKEAVAREIHFDLISKAYPRAWANTKLVRKTALDKASGDTSKTGTTPMTDIAPTLLEKPDVSSFLLSGTSVSMDVDDAGEAASKQGDVGSDASLSEETLDVNPAYQYEDVDMYRILHAEVAQLGLPNVTVVPPADDMHAGQLQARLQETGISLREDDEPGHTILVPLNIGNYHWVGVVIVLSPQGLVPPAVVRYVDPLGNLRGMHRAVLQEIQAVFPGAQIEDTTALLQTDGTSCGPLTIQNLLFQAQGLRLRRNVRTDRGYTDRLRERHVRLLAHVHQGSDFRERQRVGSTMTSSFDMQGYMKRSVAFTKRGTARIYRIAQSVRNLSDAARKPIVDAFTQICAPARNAVRDRAEDYRMLRAAFTEARAHCGDQAFKDGMPFPSLMREFWRAGDDLTVNFDTLSVPDFEEMLAIGRSVIGDVDLTAHLKDIEASLTRDDDEMAKLTADDETPSSSMQSDELVDEYTSISQTETHD
ncbi:eCIS core domain-containing protein [Pandoraea pneumonica]|uniref:eCIS core domain-containing protein n=1 Tax=Pandoraea pneumonica TaxID=2508299 RepID=UPI003CF48899